MGSVAKKYKVIRRLNADFEIIVQGRNEEDAVYSAASIDLESWNEVDSSWEIVDVSRISHLQLIETYSEEVITKPIIQIWRKT